MEKRQRDFAAAVNAEDDIIYKYIEYCSTTDVVKTQIAAIWEKHVKGDEDKEKEEWRKNIIGMKAAYEKDNRDLEELNQRQKVTF